MIYDGLLHRQRWGIGTTREIQRTKFREQVAKMNVARGSSYGNEVKRANN